MKGNAEREIDSQQKMKEEETRWPRPKGAFRSETVGRSSVLAAEQHNYLSICLISDTLSLTQQLENIPTWPKIMFPRSLNISNRRRMSFTMLRSRVISCRNILGRNWSLVWLLTYFIQTSYFPSRGVKRNNVWTISRWRNGPMSISSVIGWWWSRRSGKQSSWIFTRT